MKKNDTTIILAGTIFVLWSLGIVFIPQAKYEASGMFSILMFVYLALHMAIFIFAGSLLVKNFTHTKRKSSIAHKLYGLLYVYVMVSLAVSAYLILKTLYF